MTTTRPDTPIRLVCLDVDGTLVGPTGIPTPGIWEAAQRARSAGIHLAVCTARIAIGDVWDWACKLDPDGWQLFQTGASVVQTRTRDTHSTLLPKGAAETAEAIAVRRGWTLELYSDFDYVVGDDSHVAVEHAALLGVPFENRTWDSLQGGIVRAQYIVTADDVADALAAAPAGCVASSATSPRMPGYHFVSVTAEGVTKATALLGLAELLGLRREETMMVGDGQNDVPALSVAGFPVAMGNADPEALAVARAVVGDVLDDGAAEAIDLAIDSHC